jgi:hypothetical protein
MSVDAVVLVLHFRTLLNLAARAILLMITLSILYPLCTAASLRYSELHSAQSSSSWCFASKQYVQCNGQYPLHIYSIVRMLLLAESVHICLTALLLPRHAQRRTAQVIHCF